MLLKLYHYCCLVIVELLLYFYCCIMIVLLLFFYCCCVVLVIVIVVLWWWHHVVVVLSMCRCYSYCCNILTVTLLLLCDRIGVEVVGSRWRVVGWMLGTRSWPCASMSLWERHLTPNGNRHATSSAAFLWNTIIWITGLGLSIPTPTAGNHIRNDWITVSLREVFP